MKTTMLLLLIVVCTGWTKAQSHYPDKTPPGTTPAMFARGLISDGMSNRDMAISPSGDELLYTIQAASGQFSVILQLRYVHGAWSKPAVAPFSGRYSDLEPAFSADGQTLYFASNRPVQTDGRTKDYDIWVVKKTGDSWGSPVRLDTVVNSSKDEFYPSIARSGNLYFTREMENGKGREDIVISEWKEGRYHTPHSLPEAINSDKFEFNAFVDPDERYILFSSFGRSDDLGGGDLYLSCKNEKGEWMPAVHLDSSINSRALDFSPFISPDGKYFFFTSEKMELTPPFDPPLDFARLQQLLEGPGNGLNNIYWMDWRSVLSKYCHGH
ncbi:MAG: PD40 domain-containing protein [Chitinophagaceae bacterium]|nr:PD40 domain-containing protein [Chitinophagaceae bacterium]